MYSALWRVLPGGVILKLVSLTLIVSIVVLVLFEWAFPWIAQNLMLEDSTVE